MNKVNIHEAKTNLSKIILSIEQSGEPYHICRNGKPVVEMRYLAKKKKGKLPPPHSMLGNIVIHGDISKPLPASDWGTLY